MDLNTLRLHLPTLNAPTIEALTPPDLLRAHGESSTLPAELTAMLRAPRENPLPCEELDYLVSCIRQLRARVEARHPGIFPAFPEAVETSLSQLHYHQKAVDGIHQLASVAQVPSSAGTTNFSQRAALEPFQDQDVLAKAFMPHEINLTNTLATELEKFSKQCTAAAGANTAALGITNSLLVADAAQIAHFAADCAAGFTAHLEERLGAAIRNAKGSARASA